MLAVWRGSFLAGRAGAQSNSLGSCSFLASWIAQSYSSATEDGDSVAVGTATNESGASPSAQGSHTDGTAGQSAKSKAAGGASGGKGTDVDMLAPEHLEWRDLMDAWSHAHAAYVHKDRSILEEGRRQADRDEVHKLYAPDGTIESAYDDTSRPLYDTRVWLHMYEGPGGALLPSFCKRTGAAQYMYDFTGFSEWRVEQNALLSEEAKCLMYKLWARGNGGKSGAAADGGASGAWSDESLAQLFKIRVQRALAIVKIKEHEFKQSEELTTKLNRLQEILGMDAHPTLKELQKPGNLHTVKHLTAWFDEWIKVYELLPHIIHPDSGAKEDADVEEAESANAESADGEAVETAEDDKQEMEGKDGKDGRQRSAADDDKRVKLTMEEVNEVVDLHNALTKAANDEAKQVACHEDLWRTVYNHGTNEKYIPFLQTMPAFEERPAEDAEVAPAKEYDLAVEESTRRDDTAEIADFRRCLSWGLHETGKSIQRVPRKRGERASTLPKKPEQGWPILVTPLHAGGRHGESFVANPDSSRRPLTEDERLYLDHFKVEPRIFSRPRKHAPYTNDTLHMFTQRKPNHRHDIYNPPYEGSPKQKPPTSGPDRKAQRRSRVAAIQRRKDLKPLLDGMRT